MKVNKIHFLLPESLLSCRELGTDPQKRSYEIKFIDTTFLRCNVMFIHSGSLYMEVDIIFYLTKKNVTPNNPNSNMFHTFKS